MRIVHYNAYARVPRFLADGQRLLGHDTRVVLLTSGSGAEAADEDRRYYQGSLHTMARMMRTAHEMRTIDIVHHHGPLGSFRPDLRWARRRGTPVVAHYHGTEVRSGMIAGDENLRDAVLVSTPDLLEWEPQAELVPNPYPHLPVAPWPSGGPLRVLHMPSDPSLKGTALIRRVIEDLKADGVPISFRFVTGASRAEADGALAWAHVVIDQFVTRPRPAGEPGVPLPVGIFSMVSEEAMAIGRVAVSHLKDSHRAYYPGCMVQSAPDEVGLRRLLRGWTDDPDGLEILGARSRAYVQKVHDPVRVARQVDAVYARIR